MGTARGIDGGRHGYGQLLSLAAFLLACGSTPATSTTAEAELEAPARDYPVHWAASSPAERAAAGGWTGASLQAPPHYCNDEGGQEWCEGSHDDDCDGIVDEGCVDCASAECERFVITEERMRGASRTGSGQCVGPVYCGRVDGVATTTPPGGCGDHHCGTVIWSDNTAQPFHCTIIGRCVDGVFEARDFTW